MTRKSSLSKQVEIAYTKQLEYINAIAEFNKSNLTLENEALSIDVSVGWDETLKNDYQRRAKRAALMLKPGYQGLIAENSRLKQEMARAEVEYLRSRRELDILKLQFAAAAETRLAA